MPLPFGETQRVPNTEGLIGINSEKIASIWGQSQCRTVAAPGKADGIQIEPVDSMFFGARREIPNANRSVVTRCEEQLSVPGEGEAGDALEMSSLFSFWFSSLSINEPDDLIRPGHRQRSA